MSFVWRGCRFRTIKAQVIGFTRGDGLGGMGGGLAWRRRRMGMLDAECFRGQRRDTDCFAGGVVCPIVKDQKGGLLTAIGRGVSRMDFGPGRHRIDGVRSGWPGGRIHRLLSGRHGLCLGTGLALLL